MNLKVITPRKLTLEREVVSITVPSASGEITILKNHANLFSLLKEGIITIRTEKDEEEYMAIGGGYLETDGKHISILVSRAYNQEQIDEDQTKKAIEDAEKLLADAKDKTERSEATALLRRSLLDTKLLQKVRRRKQPH
ncbi:MAG: ATP synthase F1 subunit epsilon [Weeksellaceae bacterium]